MIEYKYTHEGNANDRKMIPKDAAIELETLVKANNDFAKELAWIFTRPAPKLPPFMQKLIKNIDKYTIRNIIQQAEAQEVFQSQMAPWLYRHARELMIPGSND